MIAVALLLAAQLTGTSTGAVDARGRGAGLAWEMSNQLQSGRATKQEIVRVVTALPVADQRQFLNAWTMAAPSLPEAVEIRRAIETSIEHAPAIEARSEPGRARVPREPPPASEDPLYHVRAEPRAPPEGPKPVVAGLLSFFFAFGIGNYYAEAYTYGVVVLALEVFTAAAFITGVVRDTPGVALGGGLAFLAAWIADWGGAIYHTYRWEPDPVPPSPDGAVGARLLDVRF